MNHQESTSLCNLEKVSQWLVHTASSQHKYICLTTARHEAIYLIWTQIAEVTGEASSSQTRRSRVLSRWLDHILWTGHFTDAANASCYVSLEKRTFCVRVCRKQYYKLN